MHSISLVNTLTFRFAGNLNQRALALGDIDHDGDNEFVIGNLSGVLAVFKGPSETPEYICSGLGTITAVAVGDVHNFGKNSVVCTNAEGQCHIFDWPEINEASVPFTSAVNAASVDKKSQRVVDGPRANCSDASTQIRPRIIERPNLTLPVPVNIARILIGDIDGDGMNEIVLGRTDRILHAYKLHHEILEPIKSNRFSSSQINEDEICTSQNDTASPRSIFENNSTFQRSGNKKDPSCSASQSPKSRTAFTGHDHGERTSAPPSPFNIEESHRITTPIANALSISMNRADSGPPSFVQSRKWYFDGQLGSLALTVAPETGTPLLLVAQPGGNLAMIDSNGEKLRETSQEWSSGSSEDDYKKANSSSESDRIDEHDAGTTTLEVATEIIGGVRRRNPQGVVTLLDLHAKSSKLWDLQVSHKLFALAKIDFIGDGCDCIVACAWDGATFAVDERLNVVHYQFPERVCAFTAGDYAVQPGRNTACLFYVNFEDEISVISSDGRTRCAPFGNLLDALKDDLKEYEDVIKWKVPDYNPWSNGNSRIVPSGRMAEFLHTCLYDCESVAGWNKEKERLEAEVEKEEGKRRT